MKIKEKPTAIKIVAVLLSLLIISSVLPFFSVTTRAADDVYYLDETGTEQYCSSATAVTADDTKWTSGWYIATGTILIGSRVTVSGEVHLILADSCNLTVSGGIQVQDDDSDITNGSANALTI
ncbi:MAG: hypothetical protein ACI4HZ_07945, partial [Ruminococcus sp.]